MAAAVVELTETHEVQQAQEFIQCLPLAKHFGMVPFLSCIYICIRLCSWWVCQILNIEYWKDVIE